MAYTVAGPDSFRPDEEEVQLPSQQGTDRCVVLRRPDLIQLISGDGDVPDVLTNLVLSMLNGSGRKQQLEITRETLPQLMGSLNTVAMAAFVRPKLWLREEAEGEFVPASWISFADKAWVFAWALGGEYQAADRFRAQPNGDARAVPPVRDVSAATE